MYFPDLTPYSYIKHESHTLNVGWLSAEYPYLTGNTTHTVAVLVKDYLRYPVHSCSFGVHQCMFCPDPISAVKMTREIRVIGLNEIAYASPTMIYHYSNPIQIVNAAHVCYYTLALNELPWSMQYERRPGVLSSSSA